MGVSTKKGDTGFTGTLAGERVSKDHLVTEAVGVVDEASSLLGLARASARSSKIKRIVLQVQKQLFTVGAEFSFAAGTEKKARKEITERDVAWLEHLVEGMEEALSLPPGFVAFGQQASASQLDVARTAVRRAERIGVRLHREGALTNPNILKYLNRLSDLIFLLAAYEDKPEPEQNQVSLDNLPVGFWSRNVKKIALVLGIVAAVSLVAVVLLLLFHGSSPDENLEDMRQHMQGMHPEK